MRRLPLRLVATLALAGCLDHPVESALTTGAATSSQSATSTTGIAVKDLGAFENGWSEAFGINDGGSVVGWSENNNFLWSPQTQTMRHLGNPWGDWNIARDINAGGKVVGQTAYVAWIWDPATETMQAINLRYSSTGNYCKSGSFGISDNDRVTGFLDNCSYTQAFQWNSPGDDFRTIGWGGTIGEKVNRDGLTVFNANPGAGGYAALWDFWGQTVVKLGSLGGFTQAYDINDQGQMVGMSVGANGHEHAVLWESATAAPVDLGTLGGQKSVARAINELGQVVGWSETTSGAKHAFLWDQGTRTMRDLGTLPDGTESIAQDLNNKGQIVGYSTFGTKKRATLWTVPSVPDMATKCGYGVGGAAFDGTYYYIAEAHSSYYHCIVRYSATGEYLDHKNLYGDFRGLHYVPATGKLVSRWWNGPLQVIDYAAGTTSNLTGFSAAPGSQTQPAADPDGATFWTLNGSGGAERRRISDNVVLTTFPVSASYPAIAVSTRGVYTQSGRTLNIYDKSSGALLDTRSLPTANSCGYGLGASASGDRILYAVDCSKVRVVMIDSVAPPPPPPPPPPTGSITGRVTAASGGAGISGAQVTVQGTSFSAVADATGSYRIDGVPAATYTVRAQATGYVLSAPQEAVVVGGQTTTLNFALSSETHPVTVSVTGNAAGTTSYRASAASQVLATASSSAVGGITVTATSVSTGQSYVALSGANGEATFNLPNGDFTFTARRLAVSDVRQLAIWPVPTNPNDPGSSQLPATPSSLPAYTGAVYRGGGSYMLTPESFSSAVGSPVRLTPGSGAHSIPIQLPLGATLSCTLLDASGNPVGTSVQVFGMQPAPSGLNLPPVRIPAGTYVPADMDVGTLPRGLAYGATKTTTQGECALPGAPAGTTVVETPPVVVTNPDGTTEQVVYRSATEVTSEQVSSGATVEVVAGPTPVLSSTVYYTGEKFGDSRGGTDIGGLIAYGWEKGAGANPSDVFAVSAGFRGLGTYTLELWTSSPGANPAARSAAVSVTVLCQAKTCKMVPGAPQPPRGTTAGGVSLFKRGVSQGTLVWKVALPGVAVGESVWFRIITPARAGVGDQASPSADDQTFVLPGKRGGGGNTFVVIGVS